MSYPAPTKPLHPERRRAAQPLPPRAPRTSAGDGFVPYPAPTSGLGHPAKFAPIEAVVICARETHQLLPVLTDVTGATQQPTEPLRFTSNNPRIPVSDTGLVITACPPTLTSRRGASEHATIQVSHGSINTFVDVTVATDFNDVVSD
jgi:hypothetical protein